MKYIQKFALASLALALAGCSVFESDKVDYRSASVNKTQKLEVPPDLTQVNKDSRYTMVDGAVSAASDKSNISKTPDAKTPVAATSLGDVRVERDGSARWLVVKRSPEQLWDPLKDFWQENGFLLAMDKPEIGIMETDWAENRAKIPMDAIRASIGKLLDSLYSTPERDKFRTRIERAADGSTEIYISHRGMIEIYTTEHNDQTIWQPRPTDPELEAEFLRRLMVKLGSSPETAKAADVKPIAKNGPALVTENGQTFFRIDEGFDRAWRRVGLTLDRTGFTVEDRDRKQGIYYVRYVPPSADSSEPGFFARLFSSSTKPGDTASKYQIVVRQSDNAASTVSVKDSKGVSVSNEDSQRILKVIAADLK